ncbi:MAG: hypothetical protein QOG91_116 [Candidatus Parcubacteria bacterium]|jgi:predicted adenylyl cyclase CyaB|nr:hypothetical protein [Candidatus Parcubacteria bacterium]
MTRYEVEIKSLLGSEENADKLRRSLAEAYADAKLIAEEKQLNHYFNSPSDLGALVQNLAPIMPEKKGEAFKRILEYAKKMSVRTRESNSVVILVIKASVGDDTSANGVKRVEFECVVPLKLAELDGLLLDSGFTYQAKWCRERQEYGTGDLKVCIDWTPGYGYMAEFEKIVSDEDALETAREELLSVMDELGFAELPQDRLERMFEHYNAHWAEYYGSDKMFVIE